MKIHQLRVRITLQTAITEVDVIGNHTNTWTDRYSCYATVSRESPLEQTDVGAVWDDSKIDFTIRYCSEVSDVLSTTHRVLFESSVYNIIGIDHMQYNKKSIKLHCQKVAR